MPQIVGCIVLSDIVAGKVGVVMCAAVSGEAGRDIDKSPSTFRKAIMMAGC
jgi:hypothetical protein